MLLDLPASDSNQSKISSLKYRLWLALLSDVDVDNFPLAVNATISTNVLLDGKAFKYVDTLINTLKPSAKAGESPITGKLELDASVEGISKASLAWVYENRGNRFIAIWEQCSSGQLFLGGSPCSGGLLLSAEDIGFGVLDNKNAGSKLKLMGGDCPEPFFFYDGPIITVAPTSVTVGAGTTFALTSAVQFKMANNAGAKTLSDITNVTDGDVGRIIEIIGDGTTYPTLIESSAVFIMKNGVSFSCAEGNRISFQITQTGVGTYAFYEVDRA